MNAVSPQTLDFLKELVQQTLLRPRLAAERLIAMAWPREWLWMGLALMTLLNTIVYSLAMVSSPPADPEALAMVPPAFQSPFLFALFLGGALVITVFALTWIGQAMGGKAQLDDILVLITWLQVVRLALQIVLLGVMMLSPALGGIMVITASVWGLVILVAFLDQAHGFASTFKAILVLFVAVLAMVVGLSILLGVMGVAVLGGV